MNNQVCIVTGANSGIGKVTAMELAKQGAHLVMICRSPEKSEPVRQEIIEKTGNQQVELYYCDFGHQNQIRKVADTIKSKFKTIDVLVNNAGFIAKNYREITQDGYEKTFAVNHLGYFMLTNLLRNELKASPQARIVSVSSEAHRFTKFDINNLQLEKGYSAIKAYALSKLCNVLFTKELAKRLQGTSIVANCLHPGGVGTNFAGDSTPLFQFIFKLGKPFLLSPEKGAATSIYLASATEAGRFNGEYFDKKKPRTPAKDALNADYAAQLWMASTSMTGMDGETF
ncbi:MAG: SDR family oxidoreductase [Microscillaceae bacterium]|nr:SDR family oxidoreductase [Microscillaceae bacterium]